MIAPLFSLMNASVENEWVANEYFLGTYVRNFQ